ncbi:MAG: zinc-binding dehydrogenase, partial [Synergistetes bacterium]|nr:zinc-binding dehydrogenase [Synergistota bacterium]
MGSTFESVMVEDIAGKDVLVLGCGPMGLLAIAVARLGGAANIIATEINDCRRKLAVDMGADYVFDPTEGGVHSNVMGITGGKGVDVVIEMSGNPAALSFGLDLVTAGGRVSLVGLFSGNVN